MPPAIADAAQSPISIADAAASVETIEDCLPIRATFAGGDTGITRDRDRNPFLGWISWPRTIRVHRLRDVVLDRSSMVLLKDGRVITETNYLQSEEDVARVRIDPRRLVRPELRLPVAICFDHWDVNHYHWLIHAMPTIHAIGARHPDGDLTLLVPMLNERQHQSLALIGAARFPFLETRADAQYVLPELHYYDFVIGRNDFAISAIARGAYAHMAAGIAANGSGRRLYIDRRNATTRRLPNEDALVERLERSGFEIVAAERLTLEQQIACFKGARLIVGQHGAGLANIAFCPPGTTIYELVPEHQINQCYLSMAMQGGLNYWADAFPTGITAKSHLSDCALDIDIDHVMRRIDELEALHAGRRTLWSRLAQIRRRPEVSRPGP